ncbi:MAG: hypothetical protein PHE70_04365 [Tepidanaerobacteraceae bacterium]|nr:hypothetical protein [Tepidanaerobacteraceae bacterium]
MSKYDKSMKDSLNYFFDVNNMLNYKYKIVDIGELKFSDIVGNEAYGLYSLLPIIDREKREEEKETYLRQCTKVIKDAPIDIDKKEKSHLEPNFWQA